MNVELNRLDARVATHSALADASRLRMVDLLALGDRSSGELATSLGLTSNLIAHHLNALEAVGLIERRHSEADRRRTYIHLRPAVLDITPDDRSIAVRRVVFVCTANSARSQLAAALWAAASVVPVASAGTHPADRIDRGALRAAARYALDLPRVTPRQLDSVLHDDDFVITVCDNAYELMNDKRGVHWSVGDPVRVGSDAAFDAAYADLTTRVAHLAPRLTAA